jgi:hypothetical protein
VTRTLYLFSDVLIFAEGDKVAEFIKLDSAKLEKEEGETAVGLSSSAFSCAVILPSDTEREFLKKELSKLLSHNLNENMVFGNDLGTLLRKEDRLSGVPVVVEMLVSILVESHLDVEGIFRLAGSIPEVQELKRRFDIGWTEELHATLLKANPHTLTSLLKIYFREMPEPLLTFDKYEPFMALATSADTMKLEALMEKVRDLVEELPLTHQTLFQYLFHFLFKVTEHSSKNLMNSRNLALMFAPNILRPKLETVESSLNLPKASDLVHYIIDGTPLLFPPQKPKPRGLPPPPPRAPPANPPQKK